MSIKNQQELQRHLDQYRTTTFGDTTMPYKEELKLRLDKCRDNKSPKLDISELYLDKLPEELAAFTWLTELDCASNNIVDISLLAKLPKLANLFCYSNQIVSLVPLTKLTELKWMYCSNNRIADLSPLAGLTKLTRLYCSSNLITDITCMSEVATLVEFRYPNNRVINNSCFNADSVASRLLNMVITVTDPLLPNPVRVYSTKHNADDIAKTFSLIAINSTVSVSSLDNKILSQYKNGEFKDTPETAGSNIAMQS